MPEVSSLRREARYGIPVADQILFNQFFLIGYSYYFQQAKWALEIIDSIKSTDDANVDSRSNEFRPDHRVPPMFRAELVVFRDSGYDRGRLVARSARDFDTQNNETFLLSNVSPQPGSRTALPFSNQWGAGAIGEPNCQTAMNGHAFNRLSIMLSCSVVGRNHPKNFECKVYRT